MGSRGWRVVLCWSRGQHPRCRRRREHGAQQLDCQPSGGRGALLTGARSAPALARFLVVQLWWRSPWWCCLCEVPAGLHQRRRPQGRGSCGRHGKRPSLVPAAPSVWCPTRGVARRPAPVPVARAREQLCPRWPGVSGMVSLPVAPVVCIPPAGGAVATGHAPPQELQAMLSGKMSLSLAPLCPAEFFSALRAGEGSLFALGRPRSLALSSLL